MDFSFLGPLVTAIGQGIKTAKAEYRAARQAQAAELQPEAEALNARICKLCGGVIPSSTAVSTPAPQGDRNPPAPQPVPPPVGEPSPAPTGGADGAPPKP